MFINDNATLLLDRELSLRRWVYIHTGVAFARAQLQSFSRSKTPPAPPQTGWTTWLGLGLQVGVWCHDFLTRASGRAWEKGSAWRACQKGGAPVRSSRLKKVV